MVETQLEVLHRHSVRIDNSHDVLAGLPVAAVERKITDLGSCVPNDDVVAAEVYGRKVDDP